MYLRYQEQDCGLTLRKGVAECYTAGNFKSVRSPSFHGFSLSIATRLTAADMASPAEKAGAVFSGPFNLTRKSQRPSFNRCPTSLLSWVMLWNIIGGQLTSLVGD